MYIYIYNELSIYISLMSMQTLKLLFTHIKIIKYFYPRGGQMTPDSEVP